MGRSVISRRITLVILAGMLCLVGVVLGYVWQIVSHARADSQAYAVSLSETMTEGLADRASSITKAASSLAQNTYVEAYFGNTSITERTDNIRIFNSFAQNAITDTPDILAVGLIDLEGKAITVGTQLDAVILANIERNYPYILDDGTFSAFFTRAINMQGRMPYYAYVMPVYDTGSPTPMTRLATCIVLCDLRKIQSVLDQQLTEPFCDIRLRGEHDLLLCARSKELTRDRHMPDIISEQIKGTNWHVSYYLDFSTFSFQGLSLNILIMLGIICGAILISVGLITRTSLAKPVDAIIERLQEGKDLSNMRLHFGNELDIIVDTIQRTFARLENSTQERIRSQTEMFAMQLHIKESELSALQSQINPHFLYNTLECMRSIGLYYQSPEIVTISTAMADIFRYSIKGPHMVTLEREMEIIHKYLDIIDVRFDSRFHVEFDILPEAMSCIIPKMTLQPLVENAIYHGLEPKKGAGSLTIRARLRNGMLIIVVQDDGVGMSAEDLEQLRLTLSSPESAIDLASQKQSVGIVNIAQRVRMFARDNSSVDVSSKPGQGTIISIRLPARMQLPNP